MTLMKKDVLSQDVRKAIYEHVKANPGIQFVQLRSDVKQSTGNVTYHLKVLIENGLIKDRHYGVQRKFYVSNYRDKELDDLTENQAVILEFVKANRDTTQTEIRRETKISQPTIWRNLKYLEKEGYIDSNLNKGIYHFRKHVEKPSKDQVELRHVRKIAQGLKGRCLTKRYVCGQSIKFRCSNGHRFELKAEEVLSGAWCARCKKKKE